MVTQTISAEVERDAEQRDAVKRGEETVARLLISLAAFPLSGYVMTLLWAWFVVPIFEVPALTIGAAMGLLLVVRFFVMSGGGKSDPRPLLQHTLLAFGFPFIVLALGLFVRWLQGWGL